MATHPPPGSDSPDVMASVDGKGADARLVIADVSRDGAWVTVSAESGVALPEWR